MIQLFIPKLWDFLLARVSKHGLLNSALFQVASLDPRQWCLLNRKMTLWHRQGFDFYLLLGQACELLEEVIDKQ